jgi:hypothetical protein
MIPYTDNVEDKEYPDIKWFCYGNTETEQLHIWAEYKGKKYERIVDSPVYLPKMIDRIWGIDVFDQAKANEVSDEIFEKDLKPIL